MSNKILFLDRDGVVNVDKNYTYKPEDIEFMVGIMKFCEYFLNHGYIIVIITNQSGIQRGLFSEAQHMILMNYIIREFADNNIKISDYLYCPHVPTSGCNCRKPSPGLFIKALEKFNATASESISVGDRLTDLEAAKSAGVLKNFLLNTKIDNSHDLENVSYVSSFDEIITQIK
jgi:D-glycero-D-manno-heptose 1,7-bisphosphate phosphatase